MRWWSVVVVVDGFILYRPGATFCARKIKQQLPSSTQTRKRQHLLAAAAAEARDDDVLSLDFSSVLAWEQYYQQQQQQPQRQQQLRNNNNTTANDNADVVATTTTNDVDEWHSSIALETLADYCLGSSSHPQHHHHVLMIGCGTSRLPDVLLDRWEARTERQPWNDNDDFSITLLDSSPTCIDILRDRYRDHPHGHRVHYICGDAVRLSTSTTHETSSAACYNIIVDKGLMDALLCNEGWDSLVSTLIQEASQVLRRSSSSSSSYVLVSYRLSKSTRQFLQQCGSHVGWTWEFDCPGSNERVEISRATTS